MFRQALPHGEPQMISPRTPQFLHLQSQNPFAEYAPLEQQTTGTSLQKVRRMSVGVRRMSVSAIETIAEATEKVGDITRKARKSISHRLEGGDGDNLSEIDAEEERIVYSEMPWQHPNAPRRSTFGEYKPTRRASLKCW